MGIQILDCTLRDGGYVNDWKFGEEGITSIITKLSDANIEIIECGFIRDTPHELGTTIFQNTRKIETHIKGNKNTMYVGMMDYPYADIKLIPDRKKSGIDGIRLTFHESAQEVNQMLVYAVSLKEKGYEVFIQPVATTSYTDQDLLLLTEKVNYVKPYAFYIVDTLGLLYGDELLRMFHLLDDALDSGIKIGFHSHNNLQMSFSNAQELIKMNVERDIIIDSSVSGMGRGAGNLCTELLAHYINTHINKRYKILPLLEVYDKRLSRIHMNGKWGYSIPYFLAAINSCHPNYATFLLDKQTLPMTSISEILSRIPVKEKGLYNNLVASELYLNYQRNSNKEFSDYERIKKVFKEKNILVLAPGETLFSERKKINEFITKEKPFIISVNCIPEEFEVDAIFMSNMKRYKYYEEYLATIKSEKHILFTSNIDYANKLVAEVVDYSSLLLKDQLVADNAMLMFLNLMKLLLIDEVFIAGFDGFKKLVDKNYYSDELETTVDVEYLEMLNYSIDKQLCLFKEDIHITLITNSEFD